MHESLPSHYEIPAIKFYRLPHMFDRPTRPRLTADIVRHRLSALIQNGELYRKYSYMFISKVIREILQCGDDKNSDIGKIPVIRIDRSSMASHACIG